MTNREPTPRELMELHTDALFTYDRNRRMRTINEPWPAEAPAPRFFLGRTMEGEALCRFRYDIQEMLVKSLERLCADEPTVSDCQTKPRHFDAYMNLLQGVRYSMGPCFLIPDADAPFVQVISITRANRSEFMWDGFEWMLLEIDYAQPCIALVLDGRIVSVCRSVRITSRAHEAGLETLGEYRGRGYAAAVVTGWAKAVRKLGGVPLYSTSRENLASQRVARKLSLSLYGVHFTVT